MPVYSKRHFGTLTIQDGAGTPATLAVTIYDDVQIEEGYEAVSWIMDEKGDISTSHPPLKGAQSPARLTFKVKQTAIVAAATLSIGSIVHRTSAYTGLTSTVTGGTATANEIQLDVILTLTDGTDTTTYTLDNAVVRGTFAFAEDGNVYQMTCEGTGYTVA